LIWTDFIDSSRYELPRRDAAPRQLPGMLGIGFGLLIGSFPFLQLAFFFFVTPSPAPPAEFEFPAIIFLFMAAFCFPAAAFVFYKSSLLLWGRTVLVIDSKHLRAVTSAGPLRSTKRCGLSRLDSLRVENPKSDVMGFRGGFVNLVAVQKRGAAIPLLRMYREELVNQLAKELPDKIEHLAGLAGLKDDKKILARDIKIEFVSSFPTDTAERKAKPVGSTIATEERRDELVIQIPELGLREMGKHGYLILVFVVLIAIIATLVTALLADKIQGSPSAGWAVVVVLAIVFVGLSVSVAARLTQKGAIHVTDKNLRFHEWNVFGDHHASWSLESIKVLRAGVEVDNSGEGVAWTHFLEVQPSNSERLWFSKRTKQELEWIATRIRDHLEARKSP
jgi:hypothetical protein